MVAKWISQPSTVFCREVLYHNTLLGAHVDESFVAGLAGQETRRRGDAAVSEDRVNPSCPVAPLFVGFVVVCLGRVPL